MVTRTYPSLAISTCRCPKTTPKVGGKPSFGRKPQKYHSSSPRRGGSIHAAISQREFPIPTIRKEIHHVEETIRHRAYRSCLLPLLRLCLEVAGGARPADNPYQDRRFSPGLSELRASRNHQPLFG